ncbi:hypothetical protein M9H77_24515 [Catharanthus roseus]|uniref:Uncharacterized protein n=2 Tax=Catharanthus roseus TaxID=4058 RepID=A0ACC0AYI1_CATRO|nr:hypothetical protein M9H77_24512 [Catharanthus roseus]KAI5665192.1 hypothetical protein M9H77_24515 [Catharanthus roseus]
MFPASVDKVLTGIAGLRKDPYMNSLVKERIQTLEMELGFMKMFIWFLPRKSLKKHYLRATIGEGKLGIFWCCNVVGLNLDLASSKLLQNIEICKRKIADDYLHLFDFSSEGLGKFSDSYELVPFINCTLSNLRSLLRPKAGAVVSVRKQIKTLMKKLRIFRDFVKITGRGFYFGFDIEDWAYKIACVSMLYWVDQMEEEASSASHMNSIVVDLLQNTYSTEVVDLYIRAVKVSNISPFYISEIGEVVSSIVDFLLPTYFMKILRQELIFLITLLMHPYPIKREMNAKDWNPVVIKAKDVARQIPSLICSLAAAEMNQETQERDILIRVFQEKTEEVKAEVRKFLHALNPQSSRSHSPSRELYFQIRSHFPATNPLGFIDFLFENLGKLKEKLISQDNFLPFAKDQIVTLHKELLSIRPHLKNIQDMQSESVELKDLWMQITNAAYQTEQVIDSCQISDFPIWYKLLCLSDVIEEIKFIKMKVKNIMNNQIYINGLSNAKVNSVYAGKRLLLDILRDIIKGEVYNMSQEDLTKKLSECHEMSEEDLAEKLYQCLKRQRYLIVMDDIWNLTAWNAIKKSFPDDKNGSRILFTSRNTFVYNCHVLRPLNDTEGEELLKKKILTKDGWPSSFSNDIKKVLEVCKGLPLAIVVVAGLLEKVSNDSEQWRQTVQTLNTKLASEGCMDILELSYNNLPDFLKPCFLYLSAAAQNKIFKVRKLIQLWIAEGLVPKSRTKSQEKLGREYLEDLIGRSLVIVNKRSFSSGEIKECRIHDLLLEYCTAKAEEERYFSIKSVPMDIPSSIGNLCNLETFDMVDEVGVRFPSTLWKMKALRNVNVRGGAAIFLYDYDNNEANVSPQLENLDSFSSLYIWNFEHAEKVLKGFPRIRELKLEFSKLWDCRGNCDQFQVLQTLTKLESLYLKYSRRHAAAAAAAAHTCTLQYPRGLKKLTLSEFRRPWSEISSAIGNLPNLEVLKLLDSAIVGKIWDVEDEVFLKLKYLKLSRLQISEWRASSSSFPCLERLVVRNCYSLVKFPSQFEDILTLKMIEFHGCSRSLLTSAHTICKRQHDMANEDLQVLHDYS